MTAWVEARPRSSLFLSVLSLGEIRKGIEGVAADRWGRLQTTAGRPLPAIDGLLAATALQHDLTLVTRNTKDFGGLNLRLVNP